LRYNVAMTTKQLEKHLSLLIIRSSMKGKYAMMEIAERYNITVMQALTLCLLEPGELTPMKSLSTFMACDPSNVTSIIEQLVNAGLVDRKEAEYDRRVKTVTLTEKGLMLRDKFLEVTANTRIPHLDRLSTTETEQLITIIEKATDASIIPKETVSA
jgi:DNA-binding MarR family transcriptional regulator